MVEVPGVEPGSKIVQIFIRSQGYLILYFLVFIQNKKNNLTWKVYNQIYDADYIREGQCPLMLTWLKRR